MKAIFNNWKTSLSGIAAGALTLYANGTDLKHILLSVGITLLGLFANDGKANDTTK